MSGVSHMLPIVVAGSILTALRYAFGSVVGDAGITWAFETEGSLAFYISQIGATYGLGNDDPRPRGVHRGLRGRSVPALCPASLAASLPVEIKSGFIGGIVAGLLAGYLTYYLNKGIKRRRRSTA